MSRISKRFAELAKQDKAAFVPFLTAGDPDDEVTAALLAALPEAGADLIELGVPFSDPMADGPAIQAASQRALKSGMTLTGVLELVKGFREENSDTPIVLMGYYNPIHSYGVEKFVLDAVESGVDGVIIVDLPPEEGDVIEGPAKEAGLDIVRLATPTTTDDRLKSVLHGAGGFLYYVSIAGVTGTKSFAEEEVRAAVSRLKAESGLPVAVGFGIRTPEKAAFIARVADGAVIGSAIVDELASVADKPVSEKVATVSAFCSELADAVHMARLED